MTLNAIKSDNLRINSLFSNRYHFKRWYKRLAMYLFDSAGSRIFSRSSGPLRTETLRRVLFIRFDQIGDVAMLLPAVKAFKAAFPGTSLDLLTSPEGAVLFEKENDFRNIFVFENNWFNQSSFAARSKESARWAARLRSENYDAAVDFRGDLRTILLMKRAGIPERAAYTRTGGGFLLTRAGRFKIGRHQVKLNLALLHDFGVPCEAPATALPFRVTEEEKKSFWEGTGRGILLQTMPLIVVHPGAGRPEKVWETGKYRRLVEKMLKDKLGQVVLVGTEMEKKVFGEIRHEHAHLTDLRGKTSLRELLVLFSAADIFIGNDSGPAHLAAAQGARVVSVFKGPNDPKVWHPWTPKLYLVTPPKPCIICGRSPCRAKRACAGNLPARRVYAAVLEAWRDTLLTYPALNAALPSLEGF